MFLCRLGARRQVGLLLRNGPSTEKFAALFHVASFPHGDTKDDAFSQLDPDQGQEVVCALMEKLIRKKVLYRERVLDRYYVIAMDGSGTLTFGASLQPLPDCHA